MLLEYINPNIYSKTLARFSKRDINAGFKPIYSGDVPRIIVKHIDKNSDTNTIYRFRNCLLMCAFLNIIDNRTSKYIKKLIEIEHTRIISFDEPNYIRSKPLKRLNYYHHTFMGITELFDIYVDVHEYRYINNIKIPGFWLFEGLAACLRIIYLLEGNYEILLLFNWRYFYYYSFGILTWAIENKNILVINYVLQRDNDKLASALGNSNLENLRDNLEFIIQNVPDLDFNSFSRSCIELCRNTQLTKTIIQFMVDKIGKIAMGESIYELTYLISNAFNPNILLKLCKELIRHDIKLYSPCGGSVLSHFNTYHYRNFMKNRKLLDEIIRRTPIQKLDHRGLTTLDHFGCRIFNLHAGIIRYLYEKGFIYSKHYVLQDSWKHHPWLDKVELSTLYDLQVVKNYYSMSEYDKMIEDTLDFNQI